MQCLAKAAMEVIDRNNKLRENLVLFINEFNIPNKAY